MEDGDGAESLEELAGGTPVSVLLRSWKYIFIIQVVLVYEEKSVFFKIVENNS